MNRHDLRSFLSPNKEYEIDLSTRKQFNFVGVGRWNKGRMYREYGATPQDAALGVCTMHRISPKDIELVVKK